MMSRACAAGVCPILAVGEDLDTSRAAVRLAARYDSVFAAVGVHPHRAGQFHAQRDEVKRLLNEKKVVAVGEIGLDWLRSSSDRDVQTSAFHEQLSWAAERHLPVSVHNRGADDDVLTALCAVPVTTVLHCFEGTWDFAGRAIRSGYFISFAGNVTFKRSDELREVARRIPVDQVLVETDSPVLAPQGMRGQRNEPAHIVETASLLASLLGLSLEAFATRVSRNANQVFRWSTP